MLPVEMLSGCQAIHLQRCPNPLRRSDPGASFKVAAQVGEPALLKNLFPAPSSSPLKRRPKSRNLRLLWAVFVRVI